MALQNLVTETFLYQQIAMINHIPTSKFVLNPICSFPFGQQIDWKRLSLSYSSRKV